MPKVGMHTEFTGGSKGLQNAANKGRRSIETLLNVAQKGGQALGVAATGGEKFFGAIQTGIGAAKTLNNNLMNTWNATRLVGQGMQTIGKAMTMFVSIPVAGALFKGAQAAIGFDEALVRVQKTTELTAKGMAQLSAGLRSQARQTRTSHTELAKMAEQIGQAGIRGVPQILQLVEVFNMLTVATDLAADDVTKSITRMANAFNIDLTTDEGVEQIRKFSNVINALENQIATTAPEIVEGLFNFAQVGSSLMQDMGEQALVSGAALVATLTSVGFSAEEAGNGLRNMALKMVQNQDVLLDILESTEKYNTEAKLTAALTNDFGQVLTDLILISGNSEKALDRVVAMFELAGIRGGKAGATLASVWPQVVRNTKIANDEFERGTSLFNEYQRALLSTRGHLEVLRNNINDLALTFGDTLLPVINQVIEMIIPAVRDLIETFDALDDRTKLLIVGFAGLLAVGGPVILFLGQMLFGLSMVGIAMHRAVGVLLDFAHHIAGVGILLSRLIGWLGKTSVLLIGVATGTAKATGGLAALVGVVTTATFWIGELWAKIALFLEGLGLAVGAAATLANVLIGVLAAAIGLLLIKLLNLEDAFARIFENLAAKLERWGENLAKSLASGFLSGAVRFVVDAAVAVANLIARFFRAFSPPKEGPLSHIDKWGKTLIDTYLKGFLNADFSILSGVGNIIEGIFKSFAAVGKIGEKEQFLFAMQAREDLAELIKTFNETGKVSQKVLDDITANLGETADEVQELIKLWLEHNKVKEELAKLEKEREGVLDTYRQEIQLIAQSNMTAEEKAEAIRQAMRGRDDELRSIEQQEDALEDELSLAEEKLEFQQNMIQAMQKQDDLQTRLLDKLEAIGKALGGMDMPDLEGLDAGDFSGAVEGIGNTIENLITLEDRINKVKGVWEAFIAGIMGEGMPDAPSLTEGIPGGFDIPTGGTRDAAPGVLGMMEKAHEIGTNLHNSWQDITEAIGEASDSLKELKDTLSGIAGFFGFGGGESSAGSGAEPGMSGFPEPSALERMGEAFGEVFDLLTGPAMEMLDRATGIIGDALAVAFDVLGEAISTFSSILESTGIGQLIMDIAQAVEDFFVALDLDWATIVGGLLGAIAALAAGIVLQPLIAITTTIAAIITVIGFLIGLLPKVKDLFKKNFERAKEIVGGVLDFISGKMGDAGETLSGIWDTVKEGVATAWEGILSFIGEKIASIAEFFSPLVEAIIGFWQHFVEEFAPIWDDVVLIVQTVWQRVRDWIFGILLGLWADIQLVFGLILEGLAVLLEPIITFLAGIWEAIRIAAAVAWMVIATVISAAWDTIKQWVVATVSKIATEIKKWWHRIKVAAIVGWALVKGAIKTAWEGIKTAIMEKVEDIKTAVKGFIDDFKQIGKDIIQGLADGINNQGHALVSAAAGAARSAIDAIKQLLGISSPSDVTFKFGLQTIEGFVQGLMKAPPKMEQAVASSPIGAMADLASTRPMAPVSSGGGGMTIHVHDPVVREEQDIDRIADEIQRRIERKIRGNMSVGNTFG